MAEADKNLQRELQKARDLNTGTIRSSLDVAANQEKVDKLTKAVLALTERLGEFDDDFKDVADTVRDSQATSEESTELRKALAGVVSGETEVDDEALADIATLAAQGKLKEAVARVTNPNAGPGTSQEDFDAAVQAKVAATLVERFKIDTSEPKPSTSEETISVKDFAKLDPDTRRSMREDLLKSLRGVS